MSRPSPSHEAIALLRDWLTGLESSVAAESAAAAQQSAEEREDRELAAAWAARHRASLRHPRPRRAAAPKRKAP